MKLSGFTSVCLSITAFLCVLSADAQKDPIDTYVRSEMQYQHIPGLALGLYAQGKVVRAEGFGMADVELKSPVGPETLFNSGSLAKQFDATAVMMLVEEGKISLDDSVRKYFPSAPRSWEPVKIENLLSHTSGLGDYSSLELTGRGAPFDFNVDLTERELLERLYKLPIVFAPDTDWAYCNTNYMLLGMIIEKASGELWQQFLEKRIFNPLGMTSTRATDLRAIIPNRASGYVMENGKLQNEAWTAQTWNSLVDGSLYLNVSDLAKWDHALLTADLLKKSTLERMWTVFPLRNGKPNPGNYGFGFVLSSVNGHRVIGHDGNWQGFHDYSALYVDDSVEVVVLTNLGHPLSRPQDIVQVVAGMYNPLLRPPDILPIPDTHTTLTGKLLSTLEAVISGNINPSDFTPEMLARVKDLAPAQEWLRTQGPISDFELVEQDENNEQQELK